MAERWVADASPIITLAKAGHLELLERLAEESSRSGCAGPSSAADAPKPLSCDLLSFLVRLSSRQLARP